MGNKIDVHRIVSDYLRVRGYDGLVNTDFQCGCTLDDLVCCGEDFSDCKPAYKVKCTPDACDRECDGTQTGWCMVERKPKPTPSKSALCKGTYHGSCAGETMCNPENVCFRPVKEEEQ